MQHYERQGYFFNEEIINYYIDLGKKDCSIAKKFKSLINLLNKKELTIKQKWTVHFFYNIFIMAFCINYMCLCPTYWNHNNRFFAVYFKYFLP